MIGTSNGRLGLARLCMSWLTDDEAYEPSSYWSTQLPHNFNLRGVGHIEYVSGYNESCSDRRGSRSIEHFRATGGQWLSRPQGIRTLRRIPSNAACRAGVRTRADHPIAPYMRWAMIDLDVLCDIRRKHRLVGFVPHPSSSSRPVARACASEGESVVEHRVGDSIPRACVGTPGYGVVAARTIRGLTFMWYLVIRL